jgi:threonine dehydrogenase-like Zn-dependent dehydrogenase
MKALVWHGKEDVRCDTVSDPAIEDARDAIIKVTSCAICGSDLHLFHNLIPAMLRAMFSATRAWARWWRWAARPRAP